MLPTGPAGSRRTSRLAPAGLAEPFGTALAEHAQRAVEGQPGFRDLPAGFEISAHLIDRTSWTEGYVALLRGKS